MYIGYANGMFHRVFFPEDIKLPLFLITVSDLAYGFAVYVLLYLLRGRFELPFYFLHVIVPETVYTIVLTVLFYYPPGKTHGGTFRLHSRYTYK